MDLFDGNKFDSSFGASEQAGLSVNTTGLLNSGNAYSVDMVFKFESNDATWENILGVSNRQSDIAFYVEPEITSRSIRLGAAQPCLPLAITTVYR